MYRLSNCVYKLEDKNKNIILFNNYNLKSVEIKQEFYNEMIKNLNENTFDLSKEEYIYLVDNKFILKKEVDELLLRKKLIEKKRELLKKYDTSNVGYMRISLTENCNMRCKYCFVDDIFEEKKDMDIKTFIDAIDFMIKESKFPHIQYFGGEPLLKMGLIKRGHEILLKAKKDKTIDDFSEEIVTNGTLLDDNMIDYFLNNNMTLIFSIDGWKNINDKNRVNIDGQGTYDTVMKNFTKFKNKNGNAEIIITISEDNINSLEKIIVFFKENYDVNHFNINSPQPTEQGWNIDGVKMAEKIINIYEFCEKQNIQIEAPGLNLVHNLQRKTYQINTCDNYGGVLNPKWGLYLFSSGELSYCNVEVTKSSHDYLYKFRPNEKFMNWHYMENEMEKCEKCIAYTVCGGLCSMERIMLKNSTKINNKCIFNKKIVEWALTK